MMFSWQFAGEHMAKPDLTKLSPRDRQELAAALAAYQDRDAKLTALVDAFKVDLGKAKFTVEEAVLLLAPHKPRGHPVGTKAEAKQTATKKTRGVAKKAPSSVDSTGERPSPGTTYKHPKTGELWTKDKGGRGAPKKEFVALVVAGSTWAELESKSSVPLKAAVKAAKKAVSKKTKT